ncbi:hypothetical protein ACHAXH_003303 [Discostella pseudostelligera]
MQRNLKLKNQQQSKEKWLAARFDCTLQVISYMQIPSEPLLKEPEEFVCELDPLDVPGGYTGITRRLGLSAQQKTVFKTMWDEDKLLPAVSKLKISEMRVPGVAGATALGVAGVGSGGGGVLFNSQMMKIPPEVDIMAAVNWSGRYEEEQDTTTTQSFDVDSTSTLTNVATTATADINTSDVNTTSEVTFSNATTSTITDSNITLTNITLTNITSSDNVTTDDAEHITTSDTQINYQHEEQQSPASTNNPLFHRKLQSYGAHTGPKPILVVKVTDKNGLAVSESTTTISDDVFGTSGDPVNLKSQLDACSMGRLTVVPGDNNSGQIKQSVYSAPGVISVKLSISITNTANPDIRNAITTAVQNLLGVTLPGPYKHVMYVLQKCYLNCGWAAYAYVGGWNSVYVGAYYKQVGVTVHELGHNFGLLHSGGLDGLEYTDHTCMLGNPLYSDDVGRMCYNAAKSWQIGWYNDRKITLNPKTALASNANWGTVVTLVGIADYQNVANIPVVLKLETDTVDDYFIAFNRAVGINADNDEADNEVTVILTGQNGEKASQSHLRATLAVGEQYVISNFGGGGRNCPIKLVSIDTSTSIWKANVQVGSSLTPTKSPTNPPVTPTKSPTNPPVTRSPTPLPTKPTKTKRRVQSAPARIKATL